MLFTLGWLVEWRLIFPTLPALVLALALAPSGRSRRGGADRVLLVVSIVVAAASCSSSGEGHTGAVGLHDLLWTGKGVDSGWGGLTWGKAWMMLSGVGGYFLIVGGMARSAVGRGARPRCRWSLSVLVQVAIFVACVAVAVAASRTSRGCAPSPSCSSARWARARC